MPNYEPPFQLTSPILRLVADICERLGRLSITSALPHSPRLRRENRIRSIHASLAIENNTLSVAQVTAVFDGKRVLGIPREIQEVRNAILAYEALEQWRPERVGDLLAAHRLLMTGLVDSCGTFRQAGVGIYREATLVHMAPPANRVMTLVDDLLGWVKRTEAHPLIASCVFHYEFEFIHPFDDGNGRMGRLWQTLILSQWQPLMAFMPVETLIHARQAEYYQALSAADKAGDATVFVEFMLRALLDVVTEIESGVAEADSQASGEKGSEKSSEKGSEKGSEKILQLLRHAPGMPARQLAEHLGTSARAVEKQLASLQRQGRLQRIGAPRGGHWKVL